MRSCWLALSLVCLPFSLAFAQSASPPRLEEAAALVRDGNWPRAQAAYEARLRANNTDARAWFGLGVAQQEQGRHREALEALTKADALRFRTRVPLLLRKARAEAQLGERDAALATLDAPGRDRLLERAGA